MARQWTDEGAYEVISLPNQTQAAFCYGFVIPVSKRNKGAGTALKGVQSAMLSDMKYDYAMCTVDASNDGMKKILESSGWKRIDQFFNTRSNGYTEVWRYVVDPDAGTATLPHVEVDLEQTVVTLRSSDNLTNSLMVGTDYVPLAEVVQSAFRRSLLTNVQWNALGDHIREVLISSELHRMREDREVDRKIQGAI